MQQLSSVEGHSLIRTFLWSATQRCLSAFWWASSAGIRSSFPWIERSTYEVIGLPLRSSKNCWRASTVSSQRWRRWPVEAMTKDWVIGSTTRTCAKYWTSVQEHYRLYGITGRWPILKSTARCTINLRMWREFCMSWMAETRIVKCVISKQTACERTDNAA